MHKTYQEIIEQWAEKLGWKAADDEGAFEFARRVSYELGYEDGILDALNSRGSEANERDAMIKAKGN